MKKILIGLMTATIALSSTIVSFAGEWKQTGQGWWYDRGNGSYAVNNWQKIDNKWYYFNQDGYMRTGWITVNGNWYYCNANGEMAHDAWIDGKYYVGADGVMYVNTTTPDGYKVDGSGNVLSSVSRTDYSEYTGEYLWGVDIASGDQSGTYKEYLNIMKIADGKVYGNLTMSEVGVYDYYSCEMIGNFRDGVPIVNNTFTVTVESRYFSAKDGKRVGNVDRTFSTMTCEFSKENGRICIKEVKNSDRTLDIYYKFSDSTPDEWLSSSEAVEFSIPIK